ncbi:MAG TPA: RluA family pseudouridine synthase, partial [Vicinamibacteria bacterium]|nr:RluA family pseudouridine synthase [Vicinamibacteria bacterium]
MPSSRSLTVEGSVAGARLDAWIAGQLPELSRARVQALMAEGRVRVGGLPVRPSLRLRGGEEVTVEVPDPVAAVPGPEDLPLTIVHDDAHLLVVDKAAGVTVHPGAGRLSGTLVNALLHHVRGLSGIGGVLRPGIVHRLDRGTSGLMVVAKDDETHRALAAQFEGRTVEKEYLAIVHGVPRARQGVVDAAIGRDPVHRKRMSVRAPRARSARSSYTLVE